MPAVDLLALDVALGELSDLDARQARIVKLRFFGGLTLAEIAVMFDVSERTVKREWQKARAFLYESMSAVRRPGLAAPVVASMRETARPLAAFEAQAFAALLRNRWCGCSRRSRRVGRTSPATATCSRRRP